MVDRLSNLIGIFQKPELDFSQNRAEHDDILGDAYEYRGEGGLLAEVIEGEGDKQKITRKQ